MFKYKLNERLKIGKQIYEKKLNIYEASVTYDIHPATSRDYLRLYRATLTLKAKQSTKG